LVLGRAQLGAQQANEFTAARRRHRAPSPKCAISCFDGLIDFGGGSVSHMSDRLAGQRRAYDPLAVLIEGASDAESLKNRVCFVRKVR
jgi:hypothetical protein